MLQHYLIKTQQSPACTGDLTLKNWIQKAFWNKMVSPEGFERRSSPQLKEEGILLDSRHY